MSESPFEVAAGQAAQSAVMSVRLLISIATALRANVEREAAAADPDLAEKVARLRQMEREPDAQTINERYAAMVRETFRPELAEGLLAAEQWPQMAAELHQLERAGVDVRVFLGDASQVAERVMQSVAPTTAQRWERTVRSHLPQETADALMSAEQWPQIAQQMEQMQAAGVDVPLVLGDMARNGNTLQDAMRSAWQQQAERARKLEAEAAPARSSQPAPVNARSTTPEPRKGRRNPLGADGRASTFQELGITRSDQQRLARMAAEAIPDRHVAGVLVVSRQWPGIAAQMRDLEAKNIAPAPRLARIGEELGRQAAQGKRVSIAAAASAALRRPAPLSPRPTTEKTGAANASASKAKAEEKKTPAADERSATTKDDRLRRGSAEAQKAPAEPAQQFRWEITERGEVKASGPFEMPAGPVSKADIERTAAAEVRAHVEAGRSYANISVVGPDGARSGVIAASGKVILSSAVREDITTASAPVKGVVMPTAGRENKAAAAANSGSCTVAGPPTAPSEAAAPAAPAPRVAAAARQDHSHRR
ncbi:hypothetical protein [Streptomyces platensis]|uniref:hypothetical protein n=1 Tax=Streptomyces platensis TaxID=58346 RepID=UPI003322950B